MNPDRLELRTCEICGSKSNCWYRQREMCGNCMLIAKTLDEACIHMVKRVMVYNKEGFNAKGRKKTKIQVVNSIARKDLDSHTINEYAEKIKFDFGVIKYIKEKLEEAK